mmetsp:Transcript_20882/g.31143  ORF Transcript_20882/g.31143 Transcript_20882/m.31143 type:complete len:344 (-) Transcript_20882:72-1103(-)
MATHEVEMLINIDTDAQNQQANDDIHSHIDDFSDSDSISVYEVEDAEMLERHPMLAAQDVIFHETSSMIIMNNIDSIFEAHAIDGKNGMDIAGWIAMRGYLAECAASCCTARNLREPSHWAGRGSVLHVLCAHDPPFFLIDLILQIQDCKNYPLGKYMVTDLDSNGNTPLHLAFQYRCSCSSVIHMLAQADPECLMIENAKGMTPLDVLLRHALSMTCSVAFFQLDMMRHLCQPCYLDSLFKVIQSYKTADRRQDDDDNDRDQNSLITILRQGNWPALMIHDALTADFSDDLSPSCLTCADVESGLYPFMLAAVGDKNTFDTVYQLLRMAPQVVFSESCGSFP